MTTNLPPYSTFRTDTKQMLYPQATSHGNCLSFVPPGFKHRLTVKFPDARLAVCEKCKRNFKTKDMCRVRNTHTGPPWTTAYMCITIDDTCMEGDGFTDKPLTVRMVQWQPYCVKVPFGKKTPVCSACKRTNRTRQFCRDKHEHRQLPWCTVYVLLSTLESAEPDTVVADASVLIEAVDDAKESDTNEESEQRLEMAKFDDETVGSSTGPTDDINDIPESKTFLAQVSCRGSSINWLELSETDQSDCTPFPGTSHGDNPAYAMMAMDPANAHLYMAHGAYSAQQHQHQLKSSQQYYFQQQLAAQQSPGVWNPYAHDTAGDTAQRRSQEDSQQHWAMYYPHTNYPAGHDGVDAYHGVDSSDAEEPTSKRQRV